MGVPQIIYLMLVACGLGVALCEHGKPREYNFWSQLLATVVEIILLWSGGFFKGG